MSLKKSVIIALLCQILTTFSPVANAASIPNCGWALGDGSKTTLLIQALVNEMTLLQSRLTVSDAIETEISRPRAFDEALESLSHLLSRAQVTRWQISQTPDAPEYEYQIDQLRSEFKEIEGKVGPTLASRERVPGYSHRLNPWNSWLEHGFLPVDGTDYSKIYPTVQPKK